MWHYVKSYIHKVSLPKYKLNTNSSSRHAKVDGGAHEAKTMNYRKLMNAESGRNGLP